MVGGYALDQLLDGGRRIPTLIPGRQRLSVFIGLILLCLVLTQFIELPTRTLAVTVFGSPLGVDLDAGWLMAILLASLVCTGTDALVRTHPRAQEVPAHDRGARSCQPAQDLRRHHRG